MGFVEEKNCRGYVYVLKNTHIYIVFTFAGWHGIGMCCLARCSDIVMRRPTLSMKDLFFACIGIPAQTAVVHLIYCLKQAQEKGEKGTCQKLTETRHEMKHFVNCHSSLS